MSLPAYPKFCWYATGTTHIFHLGLSEYGQEIPQLQTADNPMAPQGRAVQPSQDTRKTIKQSNQLSSLPHQDDCNTRTYNKT